MWPIVYFCVFIGFMALMFTSMSAPAGTQRGFPEAFKYVFILHLFTMLLMFVLMTTYVVHAFKTDLIPNDRRVLWVVVLLFGGFIACPIYWYLFLWRPGNQDA